MRLDSRCLVDRSMVVSLVFCISSFADRAMTVSLVFYIFFTGLDEIAIKIVNFLFAFIFCQINYPIEHL